MEWIFKSNTEVIQDIGKRVQERRLQMNYSQLELAEKCGLSLSLIQRIEKGESVSLINFIQVLRMLQLIEGLELLLPKKEISPILLKKLKGKERLRASKKTNKT